MAEEKGFSGHNSGLTGGPSTSSPGGEQGFLPLEGVRVLDLSRLFPGPYCSMVLADLGAWVIKVEPPGGDYMREFPPRLKEASPPYHAVNRGKKSIALNLKDPDDKELFLSLAKESDVVLEGFRPGVMERLGCGYPQVRELNPRVTWCAITGFGQTGPKREMPGHDLTYVALSGVLDHLRDEKGAPITPALHLADVASALWAVIAIMGGLMLQREEGKGSYLDISMTEAATSLIPISMVIHSTTGQVPRGGDYPFSGWYPSYGIYRTKDGGHLTFTAYEERFWRAFCQETGRDDLMDKGLSCDKAAMDEIKDLFASKTKAEWLEIAGRNPEVMISDIPTVAEALSDPHLVQRGMVRNVTHPEDGVLAMMGLPFIAGLFRPMAPGLPPSLDEHGPQIRSLGWGAFKPA